ncbi:MAG: hypothetical protein HQM04_07070 [Magnetococcales bacterium]|nr:hypothetical protein [Magnetococcales bacterium]
MEDKSEFDNDELENETEFMSLADLAKNMRMDRSHARRWIIKLGYTFHKRRTVDSGGQQTLCVNIAEANEIINKRKEGGWLGNVSVSSSDVGVFYIIQIVPELDQTRLKLGFAESLEERMAQHRTMAPTARVLRFWPCRRVWEKAAIDALTNVGCCLINNEVFECNDINVLIVRGNAFFDLLPQPDFRVPLAEYSPLRMPAS